MKLFCALALSAVLLAAINPQLKQVNTVYILAMSSGMDQYLANRLTNSGVFQVVTDPKKADAIVTDRLGETFETKLNDLYPPPAPPPPVEPKDEKVAKDGKAKMDKNAVQDYSVGITHNSSFSRGRGNIFIVDRKTRSVLWSIYEPPKNSSSDELSRTAERVVKRLKTDLAEKNQGN